MPKPLISMLSNADITSTARYGDGLSTLRVKADVRLAPEGLVFEFAGVPATLWPYADLRTAEPIRARAFDAVVMSRRAEHASLFIDDTQLLAQLLARAPHLKIANERWRTARPGLAVGGLALLSFAIVAVFDLSPSKGLASAMPQKARASLGDHVIRTMPARGKCTNIQGRQALGTLVQRLMPKGPITADNVTVLDWSLLNAFAVPGHRIVITRRIIEEARSADEVAAIIGHEAGHAAELHPEASLVRSVGFWALVQMVFTGTPGAVGNIGSVLAQLGYTRSAERAADDYGLRLLKAASISPQGMADFFRRMDAMTPTKGSDQPGASKDILSSHPTNAERVRMIEGQAAYPTSPALSAEEWTALKSICAPAADKVAAERAAAKSAADKAALDRAASEAARLAEVRRAAEARAAADKLAADKEAAELSAIEAKKIADANRVVEARLTVTPKSPPPSLSEQDRAPKADVNQQSGAAPTSAAQKSEPQQRTASVVETLPATTATSAAALDARIEAASKRIAANARDAGAYFERGQAQVAKRQTGEAIEDFSRALELQPTDVTVLFWRASQHAVRKQFDQAVTDYSDVIKLQPKNYAALNNRGSIYRSQKKLDLAIKDFTAAIAIDSKQPMALTNRALAHRDRSELDAAIVDLSAVLAANPKNPGALARRGETLELKASRDAALADYRAVLKLPEQAGGASEPHKTARARLIALGETP